MNPESSIRTLALIAGIALVVIGVGMALGGYNQTQAAQEWSQQMHSCGSASSLDAAVQLDCPDNPYAGGEQEIAFGVGLALVGGFTARFGSQ